MTEVTAIFDIGKTNKKLLLFDSEGNIQKEIVIQFSMLKDEDGFPCEDIHAISKWVKSEFNKLLKAKDLKVIGINFTSFGASFVHLEKNGKIATPLYDYLRPIPKDISKKFYAEIRGRSGDSLKQFMHYTCSPKLGMLNSGLQLYWLKKCKREVWEKIEHSLHLPQYLAYLISGKRASEYTSIGCHTALWNFKRFQYCSWVKNEFSSKLPPITTERFTLKSRANGTFIKVGFGLHDSSAALIPYLNITNTSFILISTGTWSIQLNPFSNTPLTTDQLNKDCVCYLQTNGNPVKASRLLLGQEHDQQTKRIAKFFNVAPDFNAALEFSEKLFWKVQTEVRTIFYASCIVGSGPIPQHPDKEWNLSVFQNAEEAYHSLIYELVALLKTSIQLIDAPRVKTFFVDGGFAKNTIFMNVLAYSLYQKKVIASYLPQSTALGAFLHLHGQKSTKQNELGLHFKTYGQKLNDNNIPQTSPLEKKLEAL